MILWSTMLFYHYICLFLSVSSPFPLTAFSLSPRSLSSLLKCTSVCLCGSFAWNGSLWCAWAVRVLHSVSFCAHTTQTSASLLISFPHTAAQESVHCTHTSHTRSTRTHSAVGTTNILSCLRLMHSLSCFLPLFIQESSGRPPALIVIHMHFNFKRGNRKQKENTPIRSHVHRSLFEKNIFY